MPVAAARQAEIVARDLHPLEVLRSREHAVEQLMVAGLELVALAQRPAGVLDPRREGVADRLQLAEVERARLPRERRHAGIEPEPREGLGDQGGELPIEAADLAAELGAGKPLVAAYPQRVEVVSFEQMRHSRLRV